MNEEEFRVIVMMEFPAEADDIVAEFCGLAGDSLFALGGYEPIMAILRADGASGLWELLRRTWEDQAEIGF